MMMIYSMFMDHMVSSSKTQNRRRFSLLMRMMICFVPSRGKCNNNIRRLYRKHLDRQSQHRKIISIAHTHTSIYLEPPSCSKPGANQRRVITRLYFEMKHYDWMLQVKCEGSKISKQNSNCLINRNKIGCFVNEKYFLS